MKLNAATTSSLNSETQTATVNSRYHLTLIMDRAVVFVTLYLVREAGSKQADERHFRLGPSRVLSFAPLAVPGH